MSFSGPPSKNKNKDSGKKGSSKKNVRGQYVTLKSPDGKQSKRVFAEYK